MQTVQAETFAYSMTRDQAREIVKSSIAGFISPDYVNQTRRIASLPQDTFGRD